MGKNGNDLDPFERKPFAPEERREVLEVLQRIEHAPQGETDSEIRYLIRKENRLAELERRTRQKISEDLADRIRQFRIATGKRVEAIQEDLLKGSAKALGLERREGESEQAFLERKLEQLQEIKKGLMDARLYEEAAKVRGKEREIEEDLKGKA